MSQPVAFAMPADAELDPSPIHPSWILEGTPQARSTRLTRSADRTASVYAWSCTAGRFRWYYELDEFLHIVSGEVFVTNENGDVRRLGPGDLAYFPAGSTSLWYVPKEVRKFAVCRHSMPRPLGFMLRAWNRLIGLITGRSLDSSLGAVVTVSRPKRSDAAAAGPAWAPLRRRH